MKTRNLYHVPPAFVILNCAALCLLAGAARGDSPAHDYPTVARVEFVNDCMAGRGDKLAAMYQCSCAIDRIADALTYDEFVEASTFAKYAGLSGPGGGIFRDSEHAKQRAKEYRNVESEALRACGCASRP